MFEIIVFSHSMGVKITLKLYSIVVKYNMESSSGSLCASSITFIAIKDFVENLVDVFGTGGGKSPLGFYNRLISHVEAKDASRGIEQYISGFKDFFSDYGDKLESNETLQTLPRGIVIYYKNNGKNSGKVFIEIQKFVHKSEKNPEQLSWIRNHLSTISATIKPEENALVALEKMAALTGQGDETSFVKSEMDKIREVLESGQIDMSDPSAGIMALMQSGVITNMIGGLKEGVDSGRLDPNKMLAGLQTTLTDMMTEAGGDVDVDMNEIQEMAAQFMLNQQFVNMAQAQVEEVDVD